MAIITEEDENVEKPQPESETTAAKSESGNVDAAAGHGPTARRLNPNPFMFWFYFTVAVSLVTFFFVFLSSFRNSQDPKTWFLGLPDHLRQHYAEGRTVKVQTCPNHKPIEVFTLEKGPDSSESVLIVHGLGLSSYDFRGVMGKLESKGVRVVAVDLPGSGFSEKYTIEVDNVANGIFGKLLNIYSLIREKGVFWAFDQMVDTGEIPYEEIEKLVMSRKSVKVLELGTEEVGRVLGQVIDSLQVSPVHLVLHDSALAMCATWVVENSGSLRSVTLVDTDMNTVPAFPLWALNLPVVRELVLGLSGFYGKLVNTCCSRKIDGLNMEAQRIFLKRGGGWEAVVGMGNKLNRSFDLVQWGHLKELKNVPLQVIWSGSWSEDWRNQGRQVAFGLPHARFVKHSGGRWPQSKGVDEIAEGIASFISVFTKITRQVEPEPIQKIAKEAKDQRHGHHHHHEGHPHDDTPAYVEAYGLGHGWAAWAS